MNIQISVILWTVICFFLLMLILQKLLFAPLFRCMDARQKKISDAKDKRQQRALATAEAAVAAERRAEEERATAKKDAERMIAEEQARADILLTQKRAEEQTACTRYSDSLAKERQELLQMTGHEAEKLGEIFVSDFVS